MLVRTIKDYTDRETKKIYRTTDKNPTRKVSDERGAELIAKGVAVEIEKKAKDKAPANETPTETETPATDNE